MMGPYSIHQMDDFYEALSHGHVKITGIMNYVQRLYIANRCPPGAKLVDICCGRGLQLPVLYRHAPHIDSYVGLDVAAANLDEARDRIAELDRHYRGRPFVVQLVECDVAEPWPIADAYDVAVYTSALEHMPRSQGIASLQQTARVLKDGGRLYLSTPNTPHEAELQHRVHIYEWPMDEIQSVLQYVGFGIDAIVGLLPPDSRVLARALARQFGDGAADWYEQLRASLPEPFLDAVVAAAVPTVAREVLYVCSRVPQ
jgi:ubiquinone/menaquinone biosynthesis C-methylase UbiE